MNALHLGKIERNEPDRGRMQPLGPAPTAAAIARAVESLAADGLVTASRVPRSDG